MVDVRDEHRAPLGGDPPGEAMPHRDPDPLLDLLLDPLRGAGAQHAAVVVEQQDRRRVRPQDVGDPLEQLVQQVLERQGGQRRVGDPLDRLQHAERALGVQPREPFLLVELGVLDRDRGAVGRQLEQVAVAPR